MRLTPDIKELTTSPRPSQNEKQKQDKKLLFGKEGRGKNTVRYDPQREYTEPRTNLQQQAASIVSRIPDKLLRNLQRRVRGERREKTNLCGLGVLCGETLFRIKA